MMPVGSQIGVRIAFDNRKALKVLRELQALFKPPWLEQHEDDAFDFPTWRVRNRPFDWIVDTDLPRDPADHWHQGDRRQFNLYLRPAPAVVAPHAPRADDSAWAACLVHGAGFKLPGTFTPMP